MLRNQREKDLPTNQDGSDRKLTSITSSSRSWSGLRNSRIVRVSRAFGGKDRHSKVTTVRGLRDRRVRLSVPTAIQLYDLQERLGLNQPSKVVDWLINAAQHEIDKLPPLQLPPEGFNIHGPHDEVITTPFSQRSKNQREEPKEQTSEKLNIKGNNLVSTQALLINNATSYASHFHQWEAANVYLSQLGIRSSSQSEASVMPIPYFCPPGIMPSIFPSHNVVSTQMAEFNSNGINLVNPPIEFGDKFS